MSQPPIGIDLGTTYSALAVINQSGAPEIVPNAEGERTTASAVFFPDDSSTLVGQIAIDQGESQPDKVVRWVKRHMGEPDWRFNCLGRSLSAVELSALVLRKVAQDASTVVGPVRDVVITVPAYFDEVRRKATMDAGALAGLNVLRIINEPTAAALAYAASGRVTGRCLVYDFGGGTFDVSIVDIKSATDVVVLATGGDHRLGGHDLDRELMKELAYRFQRAKSIPLVPEGDKGQEARIVNRCEEIKRSLSRLNERRGELLAWGAQTMSTDVTRVDFDACIAPYIARTEMLVDGTLEDAGLKPHQIDHVILVGGSTRIPAVTKMLERKFGKPHTPGVNPDEAVALGAAIQCALIMTSSNPTAVPITRDARDKFVRTKVSDVTAHGYGTLFMDVEQTPHRSRNRILIPRNSSIPFTQRETFYTMSQGQTSIEITITQGDESDPDFVNSVVRDNMSIPVGYGDAGREILVEYSYDVNGRLMAVFRHPASGTERRFDLETQNRKEQGSQGGATSPGADRDWFNELDIS